MFRAAVLSIVLTVVVGPNTSLLCAAWCHPNGAPTETCDHHQPTTTHTITGRDTCTELTAAPAALVRDDLRRLSAPDVQHAVIVPLQLVPPAAAAIARYEAGQSPPRDARPLVLVLRI